MSFGGVMVDQHGPTDRFPACSLLAGLLANALGYRHAEFGKTQTLQDRIEFAARWDVEPKKVSDYQTVDLGQEKMRDLGWTTRGVAEHRSGGSAAKFGTHQRYREYWSDGVLTVALSLINDQSPNIRQLAEALQRPKRPLFIGRKSCLPSRPIFQAITSDENVYQAIRQMPIDERASADQQEFSACWPGSDREQISSSRVVNRYDKRSWCDQLHTGGRWQREGEIPREPS